MVAGRDRQAETFEVIKAFRVGSQLLATHLLDVENKNRKAAAPGDLGVLLAQRTGSGIAGILEGCCALQLLLGAEVLERLMGHINFAAYLEKLRGILQLLRYLFDSPDIGGDDTVAAGRSTDQFTVLVLKAARKTVDLDFDDILRLDTRVTHSAVEITQFIVGKCIQQAFHLDGMCHFCEAPTGGAADMLGG